MFQAKCQTCELHRIPRYSPRRSYLTAIAPARTLIELNTLIHERASATISSPVMLPYLDWPRRVTECSLYHLVEETMACRPMWGQGLKDGG
jgi:hypothetical protein